MEALCVQHQQAISSNRNTLCNKIDIDTTLLDALVAKEVISQSQLENIKNERSVYARKSELLTLIYKGDQEQYRKFIDALRENDNKPAADVLTSQELQIPHIVLVADSGCRDPHGTRDILENLRDIVLHVDERCKVDLIDADNITIVNPERVSLILGTIPGSAEKVHNCSTKTSERISLAFLVTKTTRACHRLENRKSMIDLIRKYRENYMSLPNDIFFLGQNIKKDWKQHFEHSMNCKLYIPAPVSVDNDVLGMFTQTNSHRQILVDLSCTEISELDEEFIAALQTISSLPEKLIILVSSKHVFLRDLCSRKSVKLVEKWTKQDIISCFRNDTIWIFPKEKAGLTWTRMFPLLYGVPHIVHIGSCIFDVFDVPQNIRDEITWGGRSTLITRVQHMTKRRKEAYTRAHALTNRFLRSTNVHNSRADMLMLCFKNNVVRLKFRVMKRINELKDALPREETSLTQRIAHYFLGKSKCGSPTNLEIMEEIEKRLPNNVKVLKMGYGSICLYLYVPDEDTYCDLFKSVSSGETSEAMLYVLLLEWEQLFPSENISWLGVQMELHLPEIRENYSAILGHTAMLKEKLGSLLIKAASEGSFKRVELLLKNSADPNTKQQIQENIYTTPLISAVKNNKEDIITCLLAAGADPNKEVQDGETCFTTSLFEAVKHTSPEIVTLLLEAGADANKEIQVREDLFSSPLILAVKFDLGDEVDRLVTAGANINKEVQRSKECYTTPLLEAIKYAGIEVISYLLEAGADVNKEIQSDEKYLTTPLIEAVFHANVDIVTILLEAGADVNKEAQKDEGCVTTPLIIAVAHASADMVTLLIEAGADVNKEIKVGKDRFTTPLISAVENDYEEEVNRLLTAGANPNKEVQIDQGCLITPLIQAVMMKNEEIVANLLKAGATSNKEIQTKENCYNTPLIQAVSIKNERIVACLLEAGADHNKEIQVQEAMFTTPLISAVKSDQIGVVNRLLTAGADPNKEVQDGEKCLTTPLVEAVSHASVKMVTRLLEAGADVNKEIQDGEKCLTTPLVEAVSHAKAEMVTRLLESGADVNKEIQKGEEYSTTPLMEALMNSSAEIVTSLIESGADVNKEIQTGKFRFTTPLISAVGVDYEEAVDRLLAFGADPNKEVQVRENMFTTPLISAVHNDAEDLVIRLLAAGADPNKDVQDGEKCFTTPLIEAVLLDSPEIVVHLVEAGADVNKEIQVQEDMFTTPLIVAVRSTQEECVIRLLVAGADPNKKIQDGEKRFSTPLMEAVLHERAEIVSHLLKAKADVNKEVQAKEGCLTTPLIEAVRSNQRKLVKCLLGADADPNKEIKVKKGCLTTALIEAVRSNHGQLVKCLLGAGADPNTEIEVKEGCLITPLIEAVRSNHEELVNRLLAAGADPNKEIENHQGDITKPLAVAAWHKHEELFYRLLDAGAVCSKAYKGCRREDLLSDAVSGNDIEMVKYLLAMDIDANHCREGTTLLTLAISNGFLEVVGCLLDAGADPNKAAEAPFDDGTTPLIQAILTGSGNLVKLLLDKGADANKPGQCEEDLVSTPLIAAVYRNNRIIVEYLLQAGADPNYTDPVFFGKGITPLIQAVWTGSFDLVQLLLSKGADPNKPGQEKRTALWEAMIRNNPAVVSILLDAGANPHTPVESSGKKTTVLIESTARNYNEIVNILLAKGTDPNQSAMNKETVVMVARTPEVLQTLLEHGVLINPSGVMSDLFKCSLKNNHSSIPYILLQHGVNVGSNSQLASIIKCAKDRPDIVLLAYSMAEAGYSTRNDSFAQDVLIYGGHAVHQSIKRAKRSNDKSPTGQMALAETSIHLYSYLDDIAALLQKEHSLDEDHNPDEEFGQRGFDHHTADLLQKTNTLDVDDSANILGFSQKERSLEEDNPFMWGFHHHNAGPVLKIYSLDEDGITDMERLLPVGLLQKENSLDEDDNTQETVGHKRLDLLPEVLVIIDRVEAILKDPVVKNVIDPSLADRLREILGKTDESIQLLELMELKKDVKYTMHQVERLIKVCRWFDEQEQQVPTLSHLTRLSVRDAVQKATGGRSIVAPINRLRLPKILEDQLLFKNLIPTYMSQLMTTPTHSGSVKTLLQEARRVVRTTIQMSMTGDDIEQEVEKLPLRKELKELISLPDMFFLPPCAFTVKPETETQQNDGEGFITS